MKKKCTKVLMVLLMVAVIGGFHALQVRADDVVVNDFNELMTALSYAQDGDVIEIGGYIEIPVQADLGYSGKQITLKRVDASSRLDFSFGAGGSSITNIIFDGNKISSTNAIVEVANGIVMKGVTFKDCTNGSGNGGGVVIWDSTASFDGCTFEGCGASDGAAVRVNNGSSIVFNDCSFINNIATDKGGVLQLAATTPTASFTDCTMKGNSADMGGAIYASGQVSLDGCTVYSNTAESGGADVYIDEYGALTVNDSLDELQPLYEAVSLSYSGIYEEGTEEPIETPATIAGAKGLVFKSAEIVEPEPTPNPTPQAGSGAGSSSSGSTTTNNYSPTINNNVTVPDQTKAPATTPTATADPVQATATVSDGTGKEKTYTATASDNGADSLEIKEGENTITININVGTAETNGTGQALSGEAATAVTMTSEPMATATSETATPETLYITKSVNWVDVVELLVICAMALYLFRDKLKVKFQGLKRRKE